MTRPERRRLPTRSARRADALRALADAAAALVAEGSTFADLSVDRLSRRAGMSRASFYLYFEDKAELVRGWHHALDARLDDVLAEWWEATRPGADLILRVLTELTSVHRDERFVVHAIQDLGARSPLLRRTRDDAFQRRATALRRHMVRGQRAGWVDAGLAAATTAPWLMAMVDRVMQQVVPNEAIDGSLLEAGTEIIWKALYST